MKFLLANITVLFLLFSTSLFAQNRALKKANKSYEQLDYVKAAKIYEGIANNGYTSPELYKKLGDTYYYMGDSKKAMQWYKKLVNSDSILESVYYYRYSLSLKANEYYEQANIVLKDLHKKYPEDIRGILYSKNPEYLNAIYKDAVKYKVAPVNFNSPYEDYAPSIYKNKIVFTSARDTGFLAKNIQRWNYKPFTDLYIADPKSGNKATKFSKNINSKFNESAAIFIEKDRKVYFTRSNSEKNKLIKGDDKINRLQLYQAAINADGNWENINKLPFNSNQYSVANPAITPDGRTLFFASDMSGTKGMSDLYAVSILEDGSYTEPINLGDKINTEARESFPFIGKNGILYFSSDGHPGLGGFDIFSAEIDSNIEIGKITNLGSSINSSQDDFSISIVENGNIGYFASTKNGNSNIYKFTENCVTEVAGTITNQKGELLQNVSVTLLVNGISVATTNTDVSGAYRFKDYVSCEKEVTLQIEKEGYIPTTETDVDTAKNIFNYTLTSQSLDELLTLKEIYFDFDKSTIKESAKIELDKIAAYLKNHSDYKLEIAAFTDRIGNESYNLQLSKRRAQATAAYIVSQGISTSRITAVGKGEAQLSNDCFSNGPCSKSSYKLNRRSEFKISK
ncbi:OmpA family protein [Joostella atrarenae]|uniref:OmpA family protein n=1 Tax=Joostella atrarenae TaxID=679257 RepID=A0ABS9IZM8_9FLAO|nr:OmpA family protein [Joostella atrarenae]MCF8713548.1 OmpA family protein [Joostella atrarenae]